MFRQFLDATDYWFGYSDSSSAGSYDPARECFVMLANDQANTTNVEEAGDGEVPPARELDLPGPTTSVGTRTDYSVGPWDYSACATRHLKAWSTRTTQE
jgi:hypothetical protein